MPKIGLLVRASISQVTLLDWLLRWKFLEGSNIAVHNNTDLDSDTWFKWFSQFRDKYNLKMTASKCLEGCTIGLSVGWPEKLSPDQYGRPAHGTFNLHHGFRLKYRGRHMQTWAILNGEKNHGTTLHKMGESIDSGPIVDSRPIPMTQFDTAYSLTEKCNEQAIVMLEEWIPKLVASPDFVPVDHHPRPTLYMAADFSREVQTNCSPELFDQQVRALTYPGMPKPYVRHRGVKWYITPTP